MTKLCYSELTPHFKHNVKQALRNVPDFPENGVMFRDLAPLLRDPTLFPLAVDAMTPQIVGEDGQIVLQGGGIRGDRGVDVILALDARGFLFAGAMAGRSNLPIAMARKAGKLPGPELYSEGYGLEYGGGQTLELQASDIQLGQRVLIVDDLLATGGSTAAAARLVEMAGGVVAGVSVLSELVYCNGREALPGIDVHTVIKFEDGE